MATNPKARKVTIGYKGGTMTATRGLLEYILGPVVFGWQNMSAPPSGPTRRRRRKYGTKQRALASAGRDMYLKVDTGDVFTVRVTGADLDFIDEILVKTDPGKVQSVWTALGTIYGPQFPILVGTTP
jgi:hypothetical protein